MKQLPPVLIFHSNHEFRAMIKDMLIKHGFFYLLDTGDREIFMELRDKNKNHFILIENKLVETHLIEAWAHSNHFLILGQRDEKKTHQLCTLFGTHAILSFPFPAEKLSQKIVQRIS